MTPVGHSLAGLTVGCAVLPRNLPPSVRGLTLAAFVVLANAPDLPFPGWGHARYDISHSVFVTTAAILIVAAIAAIALPTSAWKRTLIAGGAIAWFSHLPLDTLYNHGKGLAMFWPLNDGRVALPIPWFATMQLSPLLSAHNLKVWATEAAFYGGFLALALSIRRPMFFRERISRNNLD